MTTSVKVPSSQADRQRIPTWDKVITSVCLVLAFAIAILSMLATAIGSLAAEQCQRESTCLHQVDHGINVSVSGTAAVLVIGLVGVIIATITRTRPFIWALATLLLMPVPSVVGNDIVNHATERTTVGRSRP
ncbi:hypothetical protein ACWDUL_01835 [Nocardia niigatensis]